jgi:hypothetical protein
VTAVDGGRRELAARVVPDAASAPADAAGPFVTSFDVPSGPFRLDLQVENAAGEIVDKWSEPVAERDVWNGAVTLGSPMLLRARTPLAYRALVAAMNDPAVDWTTTAKPAADRDYRRSERLFVRFPVYASHDSPAAVEAHLLSKDGRELVKLQAAAAASGPDHRIEVPLGSLANGSYLLRIVARAKDAEASEMVAFRVVP